MIFPIKVIYVAGLISSNADGSKASAEQREDNIEAGRVAGAAVWKAGAVALVPHLNSLGMYEKELISAEQIYLGDLAILQRCDAVLVLPGWEKSQGCNYEVAWAKHKEIPIFGTLPELEKWLKNGVTF